MACCAEQGLSNRQPSAAGVTPQAFTLGASVTRGIGASKPAFSYPQRFFQYINASFPHRQERVCGAEPEGEASPAACALIRVGLPALGPQQLHFVCRSRSLQVSTVWSCPTPLGCSGHEFYNRGIGGTSSGVYAVCAEHMVHEVRPPSWQAQHASPRPCGAASCNVPGPAGVSLLLRRNGRQHAQGQGATV